MRDLRSLRLYLVWGSVLAILTFVSFRITYYAVDASDVAGTYRRGPVMFLKVDSLPERLALHPDGSLTLSWADGQRSFKGAWRWDEKERIVRVADARWDRRIRLRSTITGPRLCMKVSDLPLEIDHHEHDEEVDLLRED